LLYCVLTGYTRGHNLKIIRKHFVVNVRVFHFSYRVISHWNSINFNRVNAYSVASLRRNLICVA